MLLPGWQRLPGRKSGPGTPCTGSGRTCTHTCTCTVAGGPSGSGPGGCSGRRSTVRSSGRARAQQLWQLVLQGLKQRRKRTFLVYAEMARAADYQDQELLLGVSSAYGKEKWRSRLSEPDPGYPERCGGAVHPAPSGPTGRGNLPAPAPQGKTAAAAAAPAPAAPEPVPQPDPPPEPPPPPEEEIPLPPEPPTEEDFPEPDPEVPPAVQSASPAPKPAERGELPEGVKKAMQVFGGEVYKE